MRIENINPDLWFDYMNEVLASWEEVLKIKQKWLDNPNPTGEFVADIRIELTSAKDNMNDTMRALVLCEAEWEAIIHTHREESFSKALETHEKVTAAEAVYRGYEPYNGSLKVYNKLNNFVKVCYAKLESVKDLANAMSAKTRDIYQNSGSGTSSQTETTYFGTDSAAEIEPDSVSIFDTLTEDDAPEENYFEEKYNPKVIF